MMKNQFREKMKIFESPRKSISDDAKTYPRGHPSILGKGGLTIIAKILLQLYYCNSIIVRILLNDYYCNNIIVRILL